ncbi:MAG: hypothetical protein P4M15_05515 [Alphaproteobacteria bacterium]|nr:hypothetical protein [Alphaproteobacteria bacterium]
MNCSQEQAETILKMVEERLGEDRSPAARLKLIWWTLLCTRSRILTNELRGFTQDRVVDGPFAGMKLTDDVLGQYQAPVLLGCYEHELHPVMERIIATPYERIINIGCSVGYYAVGLALRMPRARIDAYDISPEARARCTALAALNGVQERVHIGERFDGADFASYAGGKVLALVDIEGGEREMLDPALYPALGGMDILVELHDVIDPALSKTIPARFAATHDIEIIANRDAFPDISRFVKPDMFFDPFDHLILGWEGRGGLTPWGFFRTKTP